MFLFPCRIWETCCYDVSTIQSSVSINHFLLWFDAWTAFVHDGDLLRPNIELLITALDAGSRVHCPASLINFTMIEMSSGGVVLFDAQQIGNGLGRSFLSAARIGSILFISRWNRSIRGCGASSNWMPGCWRHWGHCVVDNDTRAPFGILILSPTAEIKNWTFATLPSQRKSFYLEQLFSSMYITLGLRFSKGNLPRFLWQFRNNQMAGRANLHVVGGQWNSEDPARQ